MMREESRHRLLEAGGQQGGYPKPLARARVKAAKRRRDARLVLPNTEIGVSSFPNPGRHFTE